MTQVEDRPLPGVSPTPPSAGRRKPSAAGRLRAGIGRAAGKVELVGRYPARIVVRWPKTSAALTAAVVAATPATLSEVAGVVCTYGLASGVSHFLGGGSPAGEPSLQDVAKYRKRRRLVRRRWVTVMTDAGLAKAATDGGQVKRLPKARRIRRTALGVSVTVDGSPVSAGPAAFRAHADKLQHGFRCREVKIYPAGSMIRLDLQWENPFKHTINFDDLPTSKPRSTTHVGIGLNSDGDVVAKDLRLPNLIVGAKGSGKSSELWAILYALVKAGIPFRLRVFDPKGGQEFVELEQVAWYYERNPTHWASFIERAGRAMSARQVSLRAQGIRDLKQFTDEHPLDIMLIDELLTALAFGAGTAKVKMDGQSIKAEQALMVYLSTCRSAGFTVLALSQLGEKNVIGPIRGLFDYATCLRVGQTETELVDMILGNGASKAYPAHELSPTRDTAGIGWMRTEKGVEKYRAAYLTDHQRRQLVRDIGAMTARLRTRAGDGS